MATTFALTLILGFPIAFCLGITSLVVLVAMDVPLHLIAQRIFTGIDSFPLMAVPFFVLAGDIMNVGGTTARLISFANVLVRKVRGGLAHTTVVSAMFLSGISGSAVADASALGSVLIPGMVKQGYGKGFASALVAAAAVMGPIIPPSIFMVIMGVTTGVSIGGLFAAGVIPGILQCLAMMAMAYYFAVKHDYPRDPVPLTWRRVWKEFVSAGPALVAPVIIIGGILGGIPIEGVSLFVAEEVTSLENAITPVGEFESWVNKVWNFGSGLGAEASLKDFRKDIMIELYNEAGQLAMAWRVYRCWPSKYSAVTELDANSTHIAIESGTLEHEGWERDYEIVEPAEPSFTEP
jgi:hypothetical protein